mmetsp:Transcript_15630/g.23884  ORF Transcript_15630/g.23884 Transcript_15630/m.23884 type:complete len:209 (-) Transcript_15630:198-824(-)
MDSSGNGGVFDSHCAQEIEAMIGFECIVTMLRRNGHIVRLKLFVVIAVRRGTEFGCDVSCFRGIILDKHLRRFTQHKLRIFVVFGNVRNQIQQVFDLDRLQNRLDRFRRHRHTQSFGFLHVLQPLLHLVIIMHFCLLGLFRPFILLALTQLGPRQRDCLGGGITLTRRRFLGALPFGIQLIRSHIFFRFFNDGFATKRGSFRIQTARG